MRLENMINNSFKKLFLNESLLLEDIAAVRKQYPKLSDEEFNEVIRIDPTFDENRNSVGKYGKWLLNQYQKNNFKLDNQWVVYLNRETQEVFQQKLSAILNNFDELKNDREVKLKTNDINSLKTPEELFQVTLDYEEKELSNRQKLRKNRASKDYEIVYEDEDWTIYVPNSWEADVALGTGTDWCTADSREDYGKIYYNRYLNEYGGEYYVLISKHDPSEKYQFHFESK